MSKFTNSTKFKAVGRVNTAASSHQPLDIVSSNSWLGDWLFQHHVDPVVHVHTLVLDIGADKPMEAFKEFGTFTTLLVVKPHFHVYYPHVEEPFHINTEAVTGGVVDAGTGSIRKKTTPEKPWPCLKQTDHHVTPLRTRQGHTVLDLHRLPLHTDSHSGSHFADGVHNVMAEAIFHDLPEGGKLAVLSGGDKGGHLPVGFK